MYVCVYIVCRCITARVSVNTYNAMLSTCVPPQGVHNPGLSISSTGQTYACQTVTHTLSHTTLQGQQQHCLLMGYLVVCSTRLHMSNLCSSTQNGLAHNIHTSFHLGLDNHWGGDTITANHETAADAVVVKLCTVIVYPPSTLQRCPETC